MTTEELLARFEDLVAAIERIAGSGDRMDDATENVALELRRMNETLDRIVLALRDR